MEVIAHFGPVYSDLDEGLELRSVGRGYRRQRRFTVCVSSHRPSTQRSWTTPYRAPPAVRFHRILSAAVKNVKPQMTEKLRGLQSGSGESGNPWPARGARTLANSSPRHGGGRRTHARRRRGEQPARPRTIGVPKSRFSTRRSWVYLTFSIQTVYPPIHSYLCAWRAPEFGRHSANPP